MNFICLLNLEHLLTLVLFLRLFLFLNKSKIQKEVCMAVTIFSKLFFYKEVVSLASVHISQASLETQITKEEHRNVAIVIIFFNMFNLLVQFSNFEQLLLIKNFKITINNLKIIILNYVTYPT